MNVCAYVCAYVCSNVNYLNVRIHVCIHVCMYICMYVCVFVWVWICMYMYVCEYVCICMYVCVLLFHRQLSSNVISFIDNSALNSVSQLSSLLAKLTDCLFLFSKSIACWALDRSLNFNKLQSIASGTLAALVNLTSLYYLRCGLHCRRSNKLDAETWPTILFPWSKSRHSQDSHNWYSCSTKQLLAASLAFDVPFVCRQLGTGITTKTPFNMLSGLKIMSMYFYSWTCLKTLFWPWSCYRINSNGKFAPGLFVLHTLLSFH